MRDEDGKLEAKEIAAICELLGLKFTVEDVAARIKKLEAKV
jgi:Ca2+-binding EF-hand superfamily protein